jgi:hypothetical protein
MTPPSLTVIDALADCPSLVAVIVVAPTATPVTTPALVTVARLTSALDHVTVRDRAFPAASRGVATSVTVAVGTSVAVDGVIETDATAAGVGGGLFGGVVPSPPPPHAAAVATRVAVTSDVVRRAT